MKPEDLLGSDPFSSWFPYIVAFIVGVITCIRSYIGGPECPSKNRIDDKIVLITGGSGGIALEIAKELSKRGATLILACKSIEKGEKSKDKILKFCPGARIIVKKLDVSSMEAVRHFVQNDIREYRKIDVLLNMAAVLNHPYKITDDKFELHLATNYLGHFLLTHLLLPKLRGGDSPSRIINVVADTHRSAPLHLDDLNMTSDWTGELAFAQSKLCLVLMTVHMAKLLEGTKVTINAVNPGIVRGTGHMRHSPLSNPFVHLSVLPWMWLLLKNAQQGAQTILYAALDSKLEKTSGKYFSNCESKEYCEKAKNKTLCADLYEKSCELLNIRPVKKVPF